MGTVGAAEILIDINNPPPRPIHFATVVQYALNDEAYDSMKLPHALPV